METVIPLFDGFTALDAVGPYEVLSRLPDNRVTFVAATVGPVRSDTGALALMADRPFAEVDQGDVLVVPGGPGTRRRVHDEELIGWIRAIDASTTWTTSVCTGAELLGAAGLLDGRSASTHWARTDQLTRWGARPSGQRVTVEGKIVTGAGVSAGIDMALFLVGQMAGQLVAESIQLGIEYDPQPPFRAGSPAAAGPDVEALVRAVTVPDPEG
jgi:putative intracellular protease/amidase